MATYSAQHLHFRWGGNFGTDATDILDTWSVGLRVFLGASALTEQKKTDFLAGVEAAVKFFHSHSDVGAHGMCKLTYMTAAYIDLDGHYVGGADQPTTTKLVNPIGSGGSGSGIFSIARVFTLVTDIDRGRGSRGRFYYPNSVPVGSDGRWTATQSTNANTQAKTLLDSINIEARENWSPGAAVSVFSGMGTGEIGTVVSVGTGRSPDTQRRRDNDLPEERVDSDLATTLLVKERISSREYAG